MYIIGVFLCTHVWFINLGKQPNDSCLDILSVNFLGNVDKRYHMRKLHSCTMVVFYKRCSRVSDNTSGRI